MDGIVANAKMNAVESSSGWCVIGLLIFPIIVNEKVFGRNREEVIMCSGHLLLYKLVKVF